MLVVKAMKHRAVRKALVSNGCEHLRTKGSHEVWGCPCGEHTSVVTSHAIVSPGVVRNIVRDLACLPKGWLQ